MKTIRLDVTSEESVSEAVETIIKAEGRIDVLVNNAGYGSYGAIEDVSLEEARKLGIYGEARMGSAHGNACDFPFSGESFPSELSSCARTQQALSMLIFGWGFSQDSRAK